MEKKAIHSISAPIPAGAYSPAILHNGMIFVSGQTPEKPGSSELVEGDITVQTEQVMENLKGILSAAGAAMNDVLKVTVHLADIKDFEGYNRVYKRYFSVPYPSRTTVQSVIPGGSLLEIDVIACSPGEAK